MLGVWVWLIWRAILLLWLLILLGRGSVLLLLRLILLLWRSVLLLLLGLILLLGRAILRIRLLLVLGRSTLITLAGVLCRHASWRLILRLAVLLRLTILRLTILRLLWGSKWLCYVRISLRLLSWLLCISTVLALLRLSVH